jgi:hypothetical protein
VRDERWCHLGCPCQLPVNVEDILCRAVGVERRQRGRCALSALAARNQLHARGFDVVDDATAAFVVADVGEEVDATTQPRESDRDVQRAAADVLAE